MYIHRTFKFHLFLPLQAKQGGVKNVATEINSLRSEEAWSEISVRIESQLLKPHSKKIKLRCESNVYTLYKGDDEVEFELQDVKYWIHDAKVQPTTDQRSGSNRGDPDNSALTGNAVLVHKSFSSRLSLVLLGIFLYFRLS